MEEKQEQDSEGLGISDTIFGYSGLLETSASGIVTRRLFLQLCVLLIEKNVITKAELCDKANMLRTLHTERPIASNLGELNSEQLELLQRYESEITDGFDRFLRFVENPDAEDEESPDNSLSS